jgi:hypothetical protein
MVGLGEVVQRGCYNRHHEKRELIQLIVAPVLAVSDGVYATYIVAAETHVPLTTRIHGEK